MDNSKSLVSIIMPAYNTYSFIGESIESVLQQEYHNWELLIINDGSSDRTQNEISKFCDKRIRYYETKNFGVSAARNLGIKNIRGEFFTFLDSDDIFPRDSLSSRISIFNENPDVSFVDGVVVYTDEALIPTGKQYIPSFKGCPFNELLKLNSNCYFGNTWMIRRYKNTPYRFKRSMTHAEDLFFYLSISKGRKYHFTNRTILLYRLRKNSAMQNFSGLEQGYFELLRNVRKDLQPDHNRLKTLKKRIIRIVFLSYLFDDHNPIRAIRSLIRFLTQV